MKILLVLLNETVARLNRKWIHPLARMAYAPTTLTQLAALIPKSLNTDIEIIDEGVSYFDYENVKADIIGLSVLTNNAPRAYKISKNLRQRGITVVMGGVHPTLMPDEASQHADAIVIGSAEKALPQLLIDFKLNKLQKIYTEDSNETFCNNLPFPIYNLQKTKRYILPWSIESSRGCNSNCGFCVISNSHQFRDFRTRTIESIINQIRTLNKKKITFLDSSPAEDINFVKRLYKEIIPLKIKWYSSITLKVVNDNEWFSLAQKSGCKGVLIGFESLNQESLNSTRKNFNHTEKYIEAIKKFHDHGISILGCFVFGFDSDNKDIFKRTLDFVNKAKIDILNYTILTPYPQTELYNYLKSQDRIIDYDWEKYNGMNVVFQPKQLTIDELQQGYEWIHINSYSASSMVKRLLPPRNSFLMNGISNIYFSIFNRIRFNND